MRVDLNALDRRYGVKTTGDAGKYHLVADLVTEQHLADPAYNTAPIGDAGLCGQLNPAAKYPRVLARHSMRVGALCSKCIRAEQHLQMDTP